MQCTRLHGIFQFPLLGIFHCTAAETIRELTAEIDFQFPLLGIFHCTLILSASGVPRHLSLSIPVTWDFPLHRSSQHWTITGISTFNSRYLGFSIAPLREFADIDDELYSFQFPLLGIFHCTASIPEPASIPQPASFNSRYLGFSIAPTGILSGCQTAASGLSIPVTWDFPLHLFFIILLVVF